MTANRALRELNDEGYVDRVAGRGTFVSDYRSQSHLLEVHNIADEIALRGHAHSSQVIRQSLQDGQSSMDLFDLRKGLEERGFSYLDRADND